MQAIVLAAGDYIEKNNSSWFRNSVTYSRKLLSNICCMNNALRIQAEVLSFILGTGDYPGRKSSDKTTSRRMLIRNRILQMKLQRQIPGFLAKELKVDQLDLDDLSNIAVEN
ncbi:MULTISPECIES: hypothetical protein [Cysteiniphilum]|uniref:Uncharacterized protein n=1 Tax=Cysteiniphilum litorale TaxID=2056700 RepID=A0A8J3E9M9_9GAMM|nr:MULTISPECIES: hypothetical protein [Cysteiniphilum]GGG09164.1 hypothetical protein GCM10010995_28450 [Cysteiniphilum litorale]